MHKYIETISGIKLKVIMHKYIETISGIKLKVIGHAPGLAFLSVASLGLFQNLVRVFNGFS